MIEQVGEKTLCFTHKPKFKPIVIENLCTKFDQAMQHLTYIAETTQSNPMLFRLYNKEKLTALLQFVKENQLENTKKV